MTEANSYRQILRSSSIIGGSSAINILVGLVRIKVVAVLLGPAGVGLVGLLQSLMTTASTIAALGFGTVGTRQIAEAAGRKDEAAVAGARRALFWGTLGLAVLGAAVFWLLRDVLAAQVLANPAMSEHLGWLAFGVALSVASGSQGALLNGLRRVGDIALVSISSGLLATVLGVGAIMIWGAEGILAFVLAGPLTSFVVGHLFVARLPGIKTARTPLPQLASQWRTMARLGAAFMVAGLAATVGQLAVRTLVQRELGPEALGNFQAAWAISMTYIGFVLAAMGTDYYPRLTATIHDHAAANRLVNEQTEVALLLAGPVFLAMLGFAPWVIELLYSSQFNESVTVLRWQILGDVLKVVSWPLGFIILAAGDSRTFMWTETLAIGVFVGLAWLGLPLLGLKVTGIAFLGMYTAYLPLVYWLAKRRTGFEWSAGTLKHLLMLTFAAAAIGVASICSEWASAGLGVAATLAFGLHSLARLGHMASPAGPLRSASAFSRKLMIKTGTWHE